MTKETHHRYGIVGLAFGADYDIEANVTIGKVVTDLSRRYKADIFIQRDIPTYVMNMSPNRHIDWTNEEEGYPPPTLQICREAVAWATKNRVETVILVAAPPHIWRCQKDFFLAMQEVRAFNLHVMTFNMMDNPNRWYCQDSTQWRTRSTWRWWSREIPLRLLMLLCPSLYKKITG